MQLSTLYNIFVRDFRKQSLRIGLTIVALAWGTLSIMLLLGFGEGMHQQMSENQAGIGTGISVIWGGNTSMPYKGLGRGRKIWFHAGDGEYLKQLIPELEAVGEEYHRWGVRVRWADKVMTQHINGVEPVYEDIRNIVPRVGGRMVNEIDIELKRRVAFIGWETARDIFGDVDPVGETIYLQDLPFTVIGVLVEKNQWNSYSGQDQSTIFIPTTTFVAVFGDPYLDNMVFKPRDLDQMDMVKERVTEALAARYKFHPDDESALSIWDIAESMREFNAMLIGIKIFLGIIGGLTLLIASVGVANIMYVSIKERTREIGIKMAVGARKSYILIQFLIEALLITATGGFIGMMLAYVATETFQRVDIQADWVEWLGKPTISADIGIIVVAILGVMGLIAGFFPALRAASVSPVESLRYE